MVRVQATSLSLCHVRGGSRVIFLCFNVIIWACSLSLKSDRDDLRPNHPHLEFQLWGILNSLSRGINGKRNRIKDISYGFHMLKG